VLEERGRQPFADTRAVSDDDGSRPLLPVTLRRKEAKLTLPSKVDDGSDERGVPLLSARSLMIFIISGPLSICAGLGAGLTTWSAVAASPVLAVVAGCGAGITSATVAFLTIVAGLDRVLA
jgi:hypothetical protein